MSNLLSRLFGRARKGSGATAKDRLRFVLQHDRINLPPERMEEMKREILAVIAKYLVVDEDRVEIDLEQRDRRHSKLVAEIPVALNAPARPQKPNDNKAVAVDGAQANGARNSVDAVEPDDEAPAGAKDQHSDERKQSKAEDEAEA